MGEKRWTRPPKVDPEAVLQIIRQEGLPVSRACERAGITPTLFTSWVRRGKWDLKERIAHAKDTYAKKLAIDTAAEFNKEQRPKHLVAFLEQFRRTGEQIDSCRYGGFSYQHLNEICNPAHLNYNWWFATEFTALLEEQQQELRDKAIKGGLSDPRSAAQLLRDIERVQRPPGQQNQEATADSVTDDQILEVLERFAQKINAPELPPLEPGPLPSPPS